ncbi:MAG: C-GCAxxG-C-C family protein [Clostridiales Family XIII bacterium]|jgi:hypothetical protein|nr:C-GCAxxG-C-C family protein [Clostridiales Family XIII bacterium]
MKLQERLFESKLKGHCCSQTIMALCIEDLGKENTDLITSMAAFCNGMGQGKICGTLAAAVAALYVADAAAAQDHLQDDLMDWFGDRYGGYDCFEIIQDDALKRIELCPGIVMETYRKLEDMLHLRENG